MGTRARLVVYAPGKPIASRAAQDAFREMDLLDAVLSDYRVDSEVARLRAHAASDAFAEPAPISTDMLHTLVWSLSIARVTHGAFDPTIAPLTQLWRQARREGAAPSGPAFDEARSRVGYGHLILDANARTLAFAVRGMALDFGAVGKGLAADRAISSLRNAGLASCMIEFGGEIVAGDPPPDAPPDAPPHARGWTIALPRGETIVLANAALATSGDAEQVIELDGVRYAHILDPRTGSPVRGPIEASVLAPLGALADPLASAVCVLGPEGLRRVQGWSGWAACLIMPDGQVRTIGNWPKQLDLDREEDHASPAAR